MNTSKSRAAVLYAPVFLLLLIVFLLTISLSHTQSASQQVPVGETLRLDHEDPDSSHAGGIDLSIHDNRSAYVNSAHAHVPAPGGEPSPWVQTNGPSGGIINTIEIDPAHPDILYAGGAGGGVFKTTDGGVTWTMLEQIVSPSQQIHDILVSPDDPQIVYGLAGWLYKSTNGGETWRVPDQEHWFSCVTMDPANPLVLIGGTWEGKVYYSSDRGESWTDITGNLPGDGIADIDIGAGNEFWVGTANGSDGCLYHR